MADPDPRAVRLPEEPIDRLIEPIERFLHVEAAGGLVLLACTAVALVLANGPAAAAVHHFWETEIGFVVGRSSTMGVPLSTSDFAEYVFGVVLVNDWSARDIQAWEYRPLGPFLGKSFATTISPWVVPLAALDAARVPAPVQDPPVLPYLGEVRREGYDIRLEVRWNGTVVSRPQYSRIYWTAAQQFAHLTANGARVRTGDLYASGTVSGPSRAESGSFIELTMGGREPVTLDGGTVRTFLEDGDSVTISATAPGPDGGVIGLGEATGRVVPLARKAPAAG